MSEKKFPRRAVIKGALLGVAAIPVTALLGRAEAIHAGPLRGEDAGRASLGETSRITHELEAALGDALEGLCVETLVIAPFGVGYLIYLAWRALKEHGALRIERDLTPRSALQVTTTAILINLLNPLGEIAPIVEAGGVFEYARRSGML